MSEPSPFRPTGAAEEQPFEPSREAHPERICPNCGAELVDQRCKLLCPNRECGYAMSCSDFY